MANNEEIGALRIDLSLDNADFTKSIQQIDSKLKGLNSEFKVASSGNKDYEKTLEGLRAKNETLGKTLELQKVKVSKLKEEYDKVAEAKGKDSIEAEKLATKYNNAVAAMKKTETQIDRVSTALKQQENPWKNAKSSAENYADTLGKASTKLNDFGDKAKNIGGSLSVGLSAPIVGLGVAVGNTAVQFENASTKIQTSLGLTSGEAQKLGETAKNVWQDGFGESLEDVTNALINVKQNMKLVSDSAELGKITQDAMLLAQTFDSDINEVTRAGNNLMINFGISSGEAFDLMASGAQNGLNFSQEMFDNLSEYSGLFADMGYTADEYFQLLVNGSKAGVYNLDYINDVMKEAQIRFKDGSKSTSDAMSQLSDSTQKVWKSYLDGNATVKDVSNSVLSELSKMDNQVLANQIGVALYGTKWEDLESGAMYSLTTIGSEMDNVSGTMNKMSEAQDKTFGQRWNESLRTAQTALLPLGETLLDVAEDWLPKISVGIEKVTGWFDKLSPVAQNTALAVGGLAVVIPPIITGIGFMASGISSIISIGTPLVGLLTGAGAAAGTAGASVGVLGTALSVLTGPVGLTIAGVAALGVGIYAVSKELGESSIQVEDWKDKVSKATAESVGSFMDLSEEATLSLNQLSWSGQEVTTEMANNIVSIYDEMGNQVLTEMQKDHADQLASMQERFANSKALTEQEEANIITNMQTKQAEKEAVITEGNARIAEIMNTASTEKRALTQAEQQEINTIQQTMTTNAVEYLTQNEREQKVILENLKNEASEITAEQAAKVVENSLKQKDEVVKEANAQYEQSVAEIIKQRDEMGTISEEQAQKLIDEAKRTKDDTISKAKEMHGNVVAEAKLQANEHANQVNWETGEVKSKWQVMKDDVSGKMKELGSNIKRDWSTAWKDTKENVGNIKADAIAKFDEMKNGIGEKIEGAKSKISGFISTIKGWFSSLILKIPTPSMPKLPHFSLETSSKTIMGKEIKYPTGFNVKWYADGGIMKQPTVFGAMGNTLLAGGEAGNEMALPLNAKTVFGYLGKPLGDYLAKNLLEIIKFPSTIVVQNIMDGQILGESIAPFVSSQQYRNTNMLAMSKGVSI